MAKAIIETTEKWRGAYNKLQSDICDLVQMAKITNACVFRSIGESQIVDGQSVPIAEENIVQALFVTNHLEQMVVKLHDDYYTAFKAVHDDIDAARSC